MRQRAVLWLLLLFNPESLADSRSVRWNACIQKHPRNVQSITSGLIVFLCRTDFQLSKKLPHYEINTSSLLSQLPLSTLRIPHLTFLVSMNSYPPTVPRSNLSTISKLVSPSYIQSRLLLLALNLLQPSFLPSLLWLGSGCYTSIEPPCIQSCPNPIGHTQSSQPILLKQKVNWLFWYLKHFQVFLIDLCFLIPSL